MSRRSRARRKQVRLTIRDSRETPRALHVGEAHLRSYPAIHELLGATTGAAWRSFLESTMRGLLRPAAIVSAVGIAAGCGGGAQTAQTASIASDTTTVASSVTTTSSTGATLVPMPQTNDGRVTAHLPTTVDDTTSGTPGGLHGQPNVVPIPDPIPLGGAPPPMEVTPPPPPPPPAHQHHRQQAHPPPDPIPMPGGIAPVRPPPPTAPPQS